MKAKFVTTLLFHLIFCTNLWSATLIETYGDSLTHGIMAKTSLDNGNPTLVSAMMSDGSKFKVTHDLSYIEKYGARRDAWPTYLKDSLEAETHASVQIANVAMVGNRSAHLVEQVNQIQFTPTGDVKAIFFMGHNDLCPSLDVEISELEAKFRESYRKALELWDSRHDGAKAYILPVANVDQVFAYLNQYVWFASDNGEKYKCNDNWGLYFPYCRKFGVLTKEGKLREVLRPRIETVNRTLAELTEEMNHRSQKNKFFFLKHVTDIDYTSKLFALDCFHLSSEGQKSLAQIVKSNLVN